MTRAFGKLTRVALASSRIVGVGTNYTLTGSMAAVVFGTTSPTLSLGPGTWLIVGALSFDMSVGPPEVPITLQYQLYNSTGAAAIGTTRSYGSAASSVDLVLPVELCDIVTLAATSTITMRATCDSGGAVTSTKTHMVAIRLA